MARAVEAANARGESTRFYFIYAGHGDVADGRGFLELEDQRIDGSFIEHSIVEKIPAVTKHILLDSCNSFFVINPRKPGGRRWATPRDMAFGFSARHPEIGLFLSTNSDADVFEWSEIESGVFSHEVRSGFSGGADVNADGEVSYQELAGFVERANTGIVRPALRPHLYYRGPGGDDHASLFPTAAMAGKRVVLDSAQTRLWIKSGTGERLIDLHKESGAMTLTVPGSLDQPLSIFVERKALDANGRPIVLEHSILRGAETVKLAALTPNLPTVGARGDRLFGALFEAPYGPTAYAEYERERATAPEPVYGLGEADLVRMHNYLTALAGEERFNRNATGITSVGIGAMVGSAAIALSFDAAERREHPAAIAVTGGLGAAFIGGGLYSLLVPSSGERALTTFEQELVTNRTNRELAFVKTEEWLAKVAASERLRRNIAFWSMEAIGVGIAGLATSVALDPPPDTRDSAVAPALLYTEAALMMAMGIFIKTSDTPTERMLKLYREDPGLKVHFGFAPTPQGGAFGLSGTF